MNRLSKTGLAVGASFLAICVAGPSYASTTPGISQISTQIDVNATLTISNVGDDFTFGNNESGTSVAATVNDAPSGAVIQIATGTGVGLGLGDANIALTNNGSVEIGAAADALNLSGDAYADAFNTNAISQYADGVVDATIVLTNTGGITVGASAQADASGYASAQAFIDSAITQNAYAGSAASIALDNSSTGSITIAALADANGDAAYAQADVSSAIYQYAHPNTADLASVTLTNAGSLTGAGSINISAVANADALFFDATAYATQEGIYQFANGYN